MDEESTTSAIDDSRTSAHSSEENGYAAVQRLQLADIGINSVLFGRGGLSNRHRGNRLFRRIVNFNKLAYQASEDARYKRLLVDSIIVSIRRIGAKFLRQENGMWVEATIEETRKKTAQALREVASDLEPTSNENAVNDQSHHKKDGKVAHQRARNSDPLATFRTGPTSEPPESNVALDPAVASRTATTGDEKMVAQDPFLRTPIDDPISKTPLLPFLLPAPIATSTQAWHPPNHLSDPLIDVSTFLPEWHPDSLSSLLPPATPAQNLPIMMDQATAAPPAASLCIDDTGIELFPKDLLDRVLGSEDSPDRFSTSRGRNRGGFPTERKEGNA